MTASTVGSVFLASGITFDRTNKLLYVANTGNGSIASVDPATGTAAGFAGTINSLGTSDGSGSRPTLQFNAGNSVTAATGGAIINPPFRNLRLAANFNAARTMSPAAHSG